MATSFKAGCGQGLLHDTVCEVAGTNDVNRLIALSKTLQRIAPEDYDRAGYLTKRIAVLTGYTVQPICALLRNELTCRRIHPVFMESDYGVFEQLIYSQDEGLLAFQPDLVYFCIGSDHLDLASDNEQGRWPRLWRATNDLLGCDIVQNTFEEPAIRTYGNYELKVEESATRQIQRLNLLLAADAPPYVHFHDVNFLASLHGRRQWRDQRLYDIAKLPVAYGHMPAYARSLASVIASVFGCTRKCLVVDLDNTLWGGVVGDDGWSNLVMGEGSGAGEAFTRFQRYLKTLKERGILLAVCSKNDEQTSREPFLNRTDMALGLDDFAIVIANWENKTENIKRIANDLQIGLHAIVFVDDNPAERDLVRQVLPDVAVLDLPADPADYTQALSDSGYFEPVSITTDDRQRSAQYRAQSERKQMAESVADYGEFLQSLEMEAALAPFDVAHLPRITQLINKTNQFNLRTKRYTLAQVQQFAEDPGVITRYVTLKDRFGDNGLIAALIAFVNGQQCAIDTWVMSCRVLKRTVEWLLLLELVHETRHRKLQRIEGVYEPTAKNGIVRDLYRSLGFKQVEARQDCQTRWSFDVSDDQSVQEVVAQNDSHPETNRKLTQGVSTMEREAVRGMLTEVAAEVFGHTVQFDDSVTSADVAEWDSLENIRLLVSTEGKFGIKFSGTEASDVHNVGDLITLIQHKLEGNKQNHI